MECSPTKKKFLMGIWFLKKGFKSNRFQVVVWSQNLRFFLFRISSQIWRFSPKLRYLRFFLFRISSQIWRFSQKLRFSFLKGFQAKKGLVLHVLCPSHPCASLARTVLKPLSFFKKMASLALTVLKPSHAIDLLPSWLWKWKVKSEKWKVKSESEKWKVKVKWCFFGPLLFVKLTYVMGGTLT